MDSLLERLKDQDLASIGTVFTMILCTSRLRNEILLAQRAQHSPSDPPLFLPPAIIQFLSSTCDITEEQVKKCWELIASLVWTDTDIIRSLQDPKGLDAFFQNYGADFGFARSIFPPTQTCTNLKACSFARDSSHKLQTAIAKQVILYTMNGPIPIMEVHLTCHSCGTIYHNNFAVNNHERVYYNDVSDVILLGDHRYADIQVVRMWMINMNTSWYFFSQPAMNLHKDVVLPEDWIVRHKLTNKHVYDGFTVLTLWEDHLSRKSSLVVPHTGEQAVRFTAAIRVRNERIRLFGHGEVRHYCEKCVRRFPATEEKDEYHVQVFVGDGVSVRRRRCKAPSCMEALAHNRDRYCPAHTHLNAVCDIIGCDSKALPGKRSCAIPAHQQMEEKYVKRGKALFELTKRHERPDDTQSLADLIEEQDDGADMIFEEKDNEVLEVVDPDSQPTATQAKRTRTCFGGAFTHNEQLVFTPCGMIIARETFYNAEGISSIAEMLKRIAYQRDRMPEYFVYDNNCSLSKHVRGQAAFTGVGLPVDVFHFKSKHSITDEWCQSHCNPAGFPDLIKDGATGWWFNTSIAEQTNVWYGRFKPMVRSMHSEHFDFVLDQMVIMRNKETWAKLEKDGFHPTYL
ncbi:hypothetical protein C8J56DRAFT_800133 [Mycena floridula]|nr:hypothetical protein C8J56DRAFT_800133 [Mycena floridula]